MRIGTISLVLRYVRKQIPDMDSLGLPQICKELALKRDGLIILTGPTGCGKSTTLAAMLDYMNRTVKRNIITIEDPIEFIHEDGKCTFSQREVGIDTRSFASGLKHVFRQDPDVILIGEMRDLETMSIALTAAETGHLVLTTLHTQLLRSHRPLCRCLPRGTASSGAYAAFYYPPGSTAPGIDTAEWQCRSGPGR